MGLGLIVNSHWAAWELMHGWYSDGQDIGWAEAVALELAVLWLIHANHHDASVVIKCDNSSVIAAFHKGRSQNTHQNACLFRISTALAVSNLHIRPTYVVSDQNKVDPVSHGIFSDSHAVTRWLHCATRL